MRMNHSPAARRALLAALAPLAIACAAPRVAPPPSATPNLTSTMVMSPNGRAAPLDLRHESSVGQRTVAASLVAVWAVLPAVFAQLEVEPTRVDSSEAVIGNPNFRARRIEDRRMSDWLDCGRAFGREYADHYTVSIGLLVQLVPAAEGGTIVRTVLDAYARDPSTSGNAVHCITWGSLERRIGELVAERVAP
ncbi:MAG: hypothetical protein FJ207_05165 [Gemmatimonadetes bacterium]|nr:hypothetical protein [Gemmatimonadota bacterium]